MKKVELYVLDESVRYERKYYGIWGMTFPRPVSLKSVGYFLAPLALMVLPNIIPALNFLALSFYKYGALYLIIPAGISYFLGDTGTDERSPFKYAKAAILYGYRKARGMSYYRGRVLKRPQTHKFYSHIFGGYLTYKEQDEGGKTK